MKIDKVSDTLRDLKSMRSIQRLRASEVKEPAIYSKRCRAYRKVCVVDSASEVNSQSTDIELTGELGI